MENKFASLDGFMHQNLDKRASSADGAEVKEEIIATLERLILAVKDGHVTAVMLNTILSHEAHEQMDTCGFGLILSGGKDVDHLIQHAFMNALKGAKVCGIPPHALHVLALLHAGLEDIGDEDPTAEAADCRKKH